LPGLLPGCSITLLDNMLTQRYCSLFNLPAKGRYRFVEADILDANLNEMFVDADVVIHLAAITNAPASFERPEEVEEVNHIGTQKVADACAATKTALLFPSSTSVYGTQAEVVDEDCGEEGLQPQSPYAESKMAGERYLQKLHQEQNLRCVICRFGTIFGTSPGMRFHTAVNKFCWQAVQGEPLTVWKTAYDQKRPYLALNDAIRAVAFIIGNDVFDGRVYNVLTANRTVRQIVDAIRTNVPDLQVTFVDSAIMNQLSYDVACERFKSLGFRFESELRDGITETIDLLRNMASIDL